MYIICDTPPCRIWDKYQHFKMGDMDGCYKNEWRPDGSTNWDF
jgi:hypothetical protein